MSEPDLQRRDEDLSSESGARMSSSQLSSSIASARTSLSSVGPASTVLLERARSLPPQVRSAMIGLVAIAATISVASALRSNETLDALEAAARHRGAAASGSSSAGASAQSARPLGARSAGPAASSASAMTSSASSAPRASASAEPAAPPSSAPAGDATRAPDSALTEARLRGAPGLEELSRKYPSDPEVLKALLAIYTRQRNQIVGVNTAERLLDAYPRAADESEVQQSIVMFTNGTPAAATEALRLLATKMGSKGPDLLYEILLTPGLGKLPKTRAAELLRDNGVRERATPALLIANDLRNALACERKALYARAKENGDARALSILKPMTATDGCGFLRRKDCYVCLEPRKELFETIAAIQKRIEANASPK